MKSETHTRMRYANEDQRHEHVSMCVCDSHNAFKLVKSHHSKKHKADRMVYVYCYSFGSLQEQKKSIQ